MTSEVVQLCQRMVATPSVNPQNREESSEPYGEKAMGQFVFDWLQRAALPVERQTVQPGRDNIVAWAEGDDPSKTLLLSGHLDTVDVKGMTVEPFAAQIRDGKIYGRGACDDKGPLAALMIAFRERLARGPLPYNLALLASCDEEYGLGGTRHFASHLPGKINAALFAEPTELQVIVAHKGVVRLHLQSRGKSAHSATPRLGKNAIYSMVHALHVVEEFSQALELGVPHKMLGCETLSANLVSGGQQINMVPDYCQAWLDWRILPGRRPEHCRLELADALREALPAPPHLKLINAYEPMETDPEHPLVRALLDAVDTVAPPGQTAAVPYATDASALAGFDIPTPICGPGRPAQAHTQDEYLEISQLENGLAAYQAFLDGHWPI